MVIRSVITTVQISHIYVVNKSGFALLNCDPDVMRGYSKIEGGNMGVIVWDVEDAEAQKF